ncbi:MAG: tetratricopeptide repeat protein [Nitrospirae bacterium]|nr:tetratricopeptide repeat protein [Nitrospirota bacterium]
MQAWFWVPPILLSLLVNLNVLANGFGWDDENIIRNLVIPDHVWELFSSWLSVSSSFKADSSYYRPFVELSYILDYKIWGDSPFGFHQSVWLAHSLNASLVFFLSRCLMKEGTGSYLSLLAASLFAVHPAHAEAVAWIAGRTDVFCTTFLLASLLLYIQFHRTGYRILFASSMSFFFFALLTKETAAGLILLFPLYEFLVAPRSFQHRWRHLAIGGTILFMILGLYFYLRMVKITAPYGNTSLLTFFSLTGIEKAIGVSGLYLKLMLFPYPPHPFIAAVPTSGFFLIFAGLALIALSGGLIVAVIRREILLGMGLAWTLALLAPAVSVGVLGLAATPAAERYVYSPSAGFLMAAAWLMIEGTKRLQAATGGSPRKILVTVCLLWIVLIGAAGRETWNRNAVWRSPSTFWQAAAAASPEAGYPHRELGVHLARQGKYLEAEAHYRQAIAFDAKALGPEHPDVARSLHNMANLYHGQGRYAEAEPLYRQAASIREKSLGSEHPDVAVSLNNLGELYRIQHRYVEAEPLYRRSLAIWEKALGPEHPYAAMSLNNLAELCFAQGRYDEAERLYRQAIMIREKALGPDHPFVAVSLFGLGEVYRVQGRYAEAEPFYRQALEIREKGLGPEHLDVAISLSSLAGLYFVQGRYTEAEPLYRRALEIQEKALGPEHPEIAASLQDYADALRKMERREDAARMEARAKAIRDKRIKN